MATLEAIWIKRMRRGPMDPVTEAALVSEEGIVGNANQGGRRQVTIIEKETFDEIRRTLPSAEPAMRRANLMVSGVRLRETRRHTLKVGATRILIMGETRPCERMDEQCMGLRAALGPEWRGGVYGVVVEGGTVTVGDSVSLEEPEASA